MSTLFLKIVNMSITASWLILAAVAIRLLIKKAPRRITCFLWMIVALRLVIPFSFESRFSLVPSAEPIPADIAAASGPAVSTGLTFIDRPINAVISDSFAPAIERSANPLQVLIPVLSAVWVGGVAAILLYAFISYLRIKKTVAASVILQKGVRICDDIKSPFILGLTRPTIYVPSTIDAGALESVLAHENAHLSRKDHWWKPLGFLLLAIYWFNPLCWLSYVLLCRDIEAACDEKVIRDMDREAKAAYSQVLLDLSFNRKMIAACPLAFGEVGVKERVKGVLKYKKPAFWIIAVAVVGCAVVAVCFLTNPKRKTDTPPESQRTSFTAIVSEVNAGTLLVTPVAGSEELRSADSFTVPAANYPEGYEPLIGDKLEIEYDGYILEIYPASLGKIYSVKLISKGENPTASNSGDVPGESTGASNDVSPDESGVLGDPIDKLAEIEREIEINTCYYDLTHDGNDETIQVTYIAFDDFDGVIDKALFHNGALGYVKLFDEMHHAKPELLWYRDYAVAHVGNVQIFVTTVDGKDYLVETDLGIWQGDAVYKYKVFFIENGEEQIVDSGKISFDTENPADTTAFFEGIYSWINDSSVLLMATDIGLENDVYFSRGLDKVSPETYYSQKK